MLVMNKVSASWIKAKHGRKSAITLRETVYTSPCSPLVGAHIFLNLRENILL